jgi:HEAT repeat protein/MFS family permease
VLKGRISGRVLGFVVLATGLATANTYGSTLAAALFLNRAGADAIPLYYILYAALSIPVAMVFSQVIDRFPRAAVFSALLIGGAVLTAAVAPAARSETKALFYALYIVISVFEQLSYSVFYVLMTDYFTSVETNRSTTAIAVGMALGGLAGGALAGAGASVFSSADLLFGMPALLIVSLGGFVMIRRRVAALGESEPQGEESLWESLAAFHPLIRRYPVVGLLALGVFLNIVVQSIIEYQVFVIYTAKFPDESGLTRFLGLLNGVLNLLNIVTSLFLTGPLLARIGVARMNVVYPAMTVSAFAALGGSFSLPSGVFSHVVYDPWAHSVDAPIFVSNYNAVPHRFVGRVRIFNDGLMYPLAMAGAGAGLWAFQEKVPQSTVTGVGLMLAIAFLACGIAIRRAYAHGLMEMLRSGSLDLANAGEVTVPATQYDEIKRLLQSGDERSQTLGLELAGRADVGVFQREIEELLSRAAGPVRAAFIRRFSGRLDAALTAAVVRLLSAPDAAVRATAAEVLVTSGHALAHDELLALIADDAPEVRGLAALDAFRRGIDDRQAAHALDAMLAGPERLQLRTLRVIAQCADARFTPLLARIRAGSSLKVLAAVLDCAAKLGATAETSAWAEEALATAREDHRAGPIHAAAYRLLAACGDAAVLDVLARGLGDPLKEVRSASAASLAQFGAAALPLLKAALDSEDRLREDAAIDALGQIGGEPVADLLFRNLAERHFPAVKRSTQWLALLPEPREGEPDSWQALAAALTDSIQRALDVALATLAALGYRRTLQAVRGILAAGDLRSRANAIETVASIGHRRFVQPLLPVMESGIETIATRRGAGATAQLVEIVNIAAVDPNRWLRAGAVLAAARGGWLIAEHAEDDPLVKDTIACARTYAATKEPQMNRVLFLKTVPLFAGLSLDDLLTVETALVQEEYLAGETVVSQGDAGATLYILARGSASVSIAGTDGASKRIAELGPGECFGEMALFDDQPRSATVVTLTDAAMLTLDRDRFSTLVMQRPEILLQMCKMFGHRLRETNRRLFAA